SGAKVCGTNTGKRRRVKRRHTQILVSRDNAARTIRISKRIVETYSVCSAHIEVLYIKLGRPAQVDILSIRGIGRVCTTPVYNEVAVDIQSHPATFSADGNIVSSARHVL